MNIFKRLFLFTIGILLILGIAACQDFQKPPEGGELEGTLDPDALENIPPEFVFVQGQQIRQWAVDAEASSEYANPEWASIQVIGAPDTSRCGDYQTAWATAGSDSIAWLEVKYPLAVHVTAVNIIQSFNPNQVIKVELIGALDRSIEIYYQPPTQVDQPCPFTLTIPIEKTSGRFDTLRITVDQSILGLGWNQIDAVELVGEPE
jgi:hypothetical protein